MQYNGHLLKYSNDGAVYTSGNNDVIWNQGFEMQEPIVSICQKYVAFADSDGKEIYVMNDSGTQGKFKVTMPVIKMDVSAHGTVAVLMEDGGTSYLALYSKSGEQLAEGAIHVENGGTPLAIALSADGQKLAVSSMDIHDGSVKSTVSFYNFGAVGENKVDHIVASYSYADSVIPELAYIGSDRVLAFSDKGVYTFTGSTEPKEGPKKETGEEIKGVFYDESYFALVFATIGFLVMLWASRWSIVVTGASMEIYGLLHKKAELSMQDVGKVEIGKKDAMILYDTAGRKLITVDGLAENYDCLAKSLEENGKM